MAAAVENSSGANGTGEIAEYKKILNIRDQIFSGSHPRLNVPSHVIRKISPHSAQTPAASASQAPSSREQAVEPVITAEEEQNGVSSTTDAGSMAPSTLAPIDPGSTHTHAPVSVSKPASEIDPIFLTKSDDLIRAEMQLQRQRIERALRDQYEQQKLGTTQKPPPQESTADFDVADVLAKALELVKPITISDREAANNGNVAASDSFDENSFYSSKAPDSPQNAEQSPPSPPSGKQTRPAEVDNRDADVRVDRRGSGAREYVPANYNSVDVDKGYRRYDLTRRSPENVPMRDVSPGPADMGAPTATHDEPEYSPPGPDVPPNHHREQHDYVPQARRSKRKPPTHRASGGNYPDSPRDVHTSQGPRVVNNHITSPAAPQPSRVSPLAVSRVSSMQGRHSGQARQGDKASVGQGSGRSSPEGPSQPLVSRKRRRVQETRDKPRHAPRRNAAESPEIPYIKPEPESPPPLADVPVSSGYARPRATRRPAPIELEPAQYAPVVERRERDRVAQPYDEGYGKSYDVESSAADAGVPRTSSGMAYRRPLRETRDLRRVASLQSARQPEYVQDYGETELEPRYARAPSYAVTDRPAPTERSQYYDEAYSAQPSYGRRYVSGPVASPSPRFHDSYAEMPRAMAPPQRRVVVDADGNRYYESVPAASPKVPGPSSSSRFTRAEEYEDGPPVRSGSMRAVSVMEHPYGERRYRQEMPPPPPVGYRRAPEYSRSVAPEPRVYDRDTESRRPAARSGSVQVVDYPAQHAPPYIEEQGPFPREEVVRMPSARPPPGRYEEPRRAVSRMPSVRPAAGREMSVYVDDDDRRPPPEYVPVERMGYGATRPVREEGFYDDEGSPKMPVERGPEMVRRISRRY